MTRLSVVVPEATTNLITNPSFEKGVTDWTEYGLGAAIERSDTVQRRGVYSMKCTPGAAGDGAWFAVTLSTTTTYAISFDVYSTTAQSIVAELYDNVAFTTLSSESWSLAAEKWYRVDFTGTTGANAACIVVIYTDAGYDDIFYIDGVQVEEKSYATTYCDGDVRGHRGRLPGGVLPYKWNGEPHNSTSTRSVYTADGGRERDIEALGGTYNVHLGQVLGAGVPRSTHNKQEYAMLDGARLQSVKTPERTLTLNFRANMVGGHDPNPGLYTAREQIEDVLKHQRLPTLQPATLVWTDTGNRIKAYYDTGLDGKYFDQDGRSYEDFALRMLAYRPWWFENGQEGADLSLYQVVPNTNYTAGRVNGIWQAIGTGADSTTWTVAADPSNPANIWIGGNFTTFNGVAHVRAVLYNCVDETFTAVGTGFNDDVYAILVAPNGDVYFGGDFTTANGAGHNRVVRYTPGTGTFSALGAGFDAAPRDFAIDPNTGYLYAVGSFTTAGGAAANYVAYWDGSSWNTLGPATPNDGVDSTARCCAFDQAGILWIGGSFDALGDATDSYYIASYDPVADEFTAFPTGLGGNAVLGLTIDINGDIYVAGNFTDLFPVTGTDNFKGIAVWNGSQWVSINGGSGGNTAYSVVFDKQGLLWLVGSISEIGGLTTTDRMALWNRSAWTNVDVNLPVDPAIYKIAISDNNDTFIVFSQLGPSESSAINTVTNSGTTDAYPIVNLVGPAKFLWLENQTTGDRLYMDLDVLDDEVIVIDTDPEAKSIVSNWGLSNRASSGILAGSDFGSFHLAPGNNTIAVFAQEYNLLDDGTFDDWTGGDLDYWSTTNCNDDEETTNPFGGGGSSVKVTATAAGGYISQQTSVDELRYYKLRFFYKNTASDVAQYAIRDITNGANIVAATDLADSTSWSDMQEVEFQTPDDCETIEIRLGAKNNTDIVWFDNAAVIGARCEIYWDILHLAAEGGVTA